MGVIKVFISLCLIASICVHADLEDELDPITGNGSVEQVFRERRSMSDDYGDCMKTKICFGNAPGCEKEKNCQYMVAIQKSGDNYLFHLSYNDAGPDPEKPGKSKYVAVGIAENGLKMKDVAIITCHNNAPVSDANIEKSWSTEATSKKIFTFSEEIIADGTKTISSVDKALDCQFALKPSFTITYAGKANSFDLNTKTYQILIAVGGYDPENVKGKVDGVPESGTKMLYHTIGKRRISGKVDLKNPTEDPTPKDPSSDKTDSSGAFYLLPSFTTIVLVFKCIIIVSMNVS